MNTSDEKTPTLCLNMIVKNEGKRMKRCLQHVKKYIDYYVICDTGSVDTATVSTVLKTIDDEFKVDVISLNVILTITPPRQQQLEMLMCM